MDLASLLTAHYVLSLGSIREAARTLSRPVSSVAAGLSRLQVHIATPLTTAAANRIQPTLEGLRVGHDLKRAADLILDLARLSASPDGMPIEQHAAKLSVPMLALQRFLVVGRSGSIRRAALEISIGQPQLTRQLKSLEQSFGIPLLDRTAAGAFPNEKGKQVIALGEELEAIWLRISDRAGDRFRRANTMTHVGSVTPLGRESLVAKILARLAVEWPKRMPRRPLYISSTNAEELLAGLSARLYDLAIVDTVELPQGIGHRVISRAGLALVGAADVITAEDGDLRRLLLNRPIALPSLKSGLRQKFVDLTTDILAAPERARLSFVEIDSIPVIANLVADHGYIALLPQWAIPHLEAGMTAVALPPAYDMQLSLAWREGTASEAIAGMASQILDAAGLTKSGLPVRQAG
jgi:LysR family nitrogen assimilation transcriptional regulator